ncbi:MAG: 4Fe-4S dicluster domain-containing protein, partial [Candidatus Bipolaricaulia bacterium]
MVIATRTESRYTIHTHKAPPRTKPLVRPMIVRSEACVNCGICIDACIYGVHYRSSDLRMIIGEQPQDQNLCRSCLRCVRECPQNALSAPLQPHWLHTGDGYWTPEIIQSILQQAETGKVPVSGQGYRGPFAGKDFDSMWTDMSEIVRPTRDGIHGREYISTAIFLGRKPCAVEALTPNPSPVAHPRERGGAAGVRAISILEIPIPVLFDAVPEHCDTPSVREALLMAAQTLGTFCIRRIEECPTPLPTALAPLLRPDDVTRYPEVIRQATLLEVTCDDPKTIQHALAQIRQLNPNAVIAVRVEFDAEKA